MNKEYTPAEAKAWLNGYDEAKRIHGQPTKIMGPNLEGVLDSAGFVKKKEWVGLTEQEQSDIAWQKDMSRLWIVTATEAKLKEKNA